MMTRSSTRLSSKSLRFLIVTAALAGLAVGCADRAMGVRAHRARFPVEVGMTAQDVLEHWGRPAEVLRLQTSDGGVTEEWRYPYGRLADNGGRARIPSSSGSAAVASWQHWNSDYGEVLLHHVTA
jgi:hypothetical protein